MAPGEPQHAAALVHALPLLFWSADEHGRTDYLGPHWSRVLGVRGLEDWRAGAWLEPAYREEMTERWLASVRTGEPFRVVARLRDTAGAARWYDATAVRSLDETGRPRWYGGMLDVTEQRERPAAVAALGAERERALVTLASIADAVVTTGPDGRVDYLNPAAERLTGWTCEDAAGRPVEEVVELLCERTGEVRENPVRRCLAAGEVVQLGDRTLLRTRHGRRVAVEDTAAPIRPPAPSADAAADEDAADPRGPAREDAGATDGLVGAVLVLRDMTEQRRHARELAEQASHDALTGLVNRRELERRLRAALDAATAGSPTPAVLLYLDLDQFKVVNDTGGHAAGDELLRRLAPVLLAGVGPEDTVARLGGDEFGILLHGRTAGSAHAAAVALQAAVAGHRSSWEGRVLRVGASVGLVPLTPEAGGLDEVLRAADSACYVAKDSGRGRVHVYGPDDEVVARRHGEMQWVSRLGDALERRRLVLHAQPIAPTRGGGGPHVEVLVRLRDDDDRLVLPGAFMPAAERYQLATAVDLYVVEETLRFFAERPGLVERVGRCSVNLSGDTVGDASTHRRIAALLDRYGLPGDRFCFEVTETAAIGNVEDARAFMQLLHGRGCTVALDDFGSGLSSFGYLRSLPVDVLKIDGRFVRGVLDDPVDRALVRSVQEVAGLLGLETVAEYVETDALRTAVTALGVDHLQGYAVGRPGPLADVLGALLDGS